MAEHVCAHETAHSTKECILCGKCLAVCPLVAATGREELSPKAKFVLRDALETGKTLDERAAARLAALCLACGRCEKICPQGLCGPDLAAKLRAAHPGWREWLWKQWLTRPRTLWPAAHTLAERLPEPLAKLGGEPGRALKRGFMALRRDPAIAPWLAVRAYPSCGRERKAVLFSGCTARHGRPAWIATARELLIELGFEIAEADFACCGCSMGHAGLEEVQCDMQRANLAAWRAAGRPLVVAFCATCRCGLRGYVRAPLGWEPMEREAWLAAVMPLAGLLDGVEFRVLEHAPKRVLYHRPCHGAGGDQDRKLLLRTLGSRLVKSGLEQCCGFGGVMQLGAPELSAAVAERAWTHYAARPGDQLMTGCSACALHLAATAPDGVTVGHWLELLRP